MKQVLIRPELCTGCLSCSLACAVAHSKAGSLFGSILGGEKPKTRFYVHRQGGKNLPLTCRHCTNAPCVDACVVDSMHTNEEGLVTNHDRLDSCIGCWLCVMDCPFGVIRENGEAEPRAIKCDRQCLSDDGQPACVRSCPTGALSFEEVSEYSTKIRENFFKQWLKSGQL